MYGNFFVLFAMLLTGAVCRRRGVLNEQVNKGINRFVVYFAYPCLIVYTIGNMSMQRSALLDFAATLLVSCGFFALYGVVAALYVRLRGFERQASKAAGTAEAAGVAALSMSLPNDGFMGFPIAALFFGEAGLLLMIAHNAAMCLYAFSAGTLQMEGDIKAGRGMCRRLAQSAGQVLINPNILALAAGLALCLLQAPIPGPVNEYLRLTGGVATPMAMLFIGSTLAEGGFRRALTDRVALEASAVRLLAMPLLTLLLVRLPPLYGWLSPLARQIVVLGGCFPTAALAAVLAGQAGKDEALAGRILFTTTVFSMGSILLFYKAAGVVIG